MKYYNKNQIISIELIDEEEVKDIIWKEEDKGFLGLFFKEEEGFYQYKSRYESRYPGFVKIDKIPENCYEKNEIIFTKPRIFINYSDLEFKSIYFNTNKERNLYFKRNFSDLNLIS